MPKATTKAQKKKPVVKTVKTDVAPKKAVRKTKAPSLATGTISPSIEKQEIIAKFQVKQGDTGSPEVQAALLTGRIHKLVQHLKINPSDNHSRRGLLGIVSKRRRLLNYLGKKDKKRYQEISQKLDLAK